MNISIPQSLHAWVKQTAADDGHTTVSEFFRQLIREEQKRRLAQHLDYTLTESLESGPATPLDWDDLRRKKGLVQKRVT